MKVAIAFASGLLFAVGLTLSGMTMPSKIIGFLDLFGAWDPSLLFVMGAALAVYLPVWWLMKGRKSLISRGEIRDTRRDLDAKLFMGAGIFGIGWAIGGLCPGPAITNIGKPTGHGIVFVVAMVVGMMMFNFVSRKRPMPAAIPSAPQTAES